MSRTATHLGMMGFVITARHLSWILSDTDRTWDWLAEYNASSLNSRAHRQSMTVESTNTALDERTTRALIPPVFLRPIPHDPAIG